MRDTQWREIAERYGTPCYIFDADVLTRRIEKIQQVLGPSVSLCYSIKANPFLVRSVQPLIRYLEVCSPGEFDICKALSVPMEKVLLSGVCKAPEDIADAVACSAALYTAESPRQARLLEKAAGRAGKRLPVLLRITAGSQFGMDEADFFSLLSSSDFPHLEFIGIHYFSGTQHTKPAKLLAEIDYLDQLLGRAAIQCGWKAQKVEYGPGLAVPYFEGDDFSFPMAPLEAIARPLRALAAKVDLTVEMGRFFAAECGYYLTRIVDLKTSGKTQYAFVDGGINHVNYYGQMMGMKVPVIHTLSEGPAVPPSHDYTLCGSLCTLADVLVRKVSLPRLEIGDILVLCNIGAYSVTEGLYLFLSRRMPRVILYDSAHGARLVRENIDTARLNMERGSVF